jgi:predicted RNA binding protein YcfA (HicA-like mRNA interferase family)
MAKIPSDVIASELIKKLGKIGWVVISQKGSHVKLKKDNKQPLIIPNHKPIKKGTLKSILEQLSEYTQKTTEEIIQELDL